MNIFNYKRIFCFLIKFSVQIFIWALCVFGKNLKNSKIFFALCSIMQNQEKKLPKKSFWPLLGFFFLETNMGESLITHRGFFILTVTRVYKGYYILTEKVLVFRKFRCLLQNMFVFTPSYVFVILAITNNKIV